MELKIQYVAIYTRLSKTVLNNEFCYALVLDQIFPDSPDRFM